MNNKISLVGFVITLIGGIMPGVIVILLIIYFIVTGEVLAIGLQDVSFSKMSALSLFLYMIIDIAFIIRAAFWIKNPNTSKLGSVVAIIAGCSGFNLIAIAGGIVGAIGSFIKK